MKRKYWVTLVVLAATAAVYYGWLFLQVPDTPESLGERAVSGRSLQERVNAVSLLVPFKDREPKERDEAIYQLRRVAARSSEPEVKSAALVALASARDLQSYQMFFEALEDDNVAVRAAGLAGVKLGYPEGKLPQKLEFDPDGSPQERRAVIKKLVEIREQGNKKLRENIAKTLSKK